MSPWTVWRDWRPLLINLSPPPLSRFFYIKDNENFDFLIFILHVSNESNENVVFEATKYKNISAVRKYMKIPVIWVR